MTTSGIIDACDATAHLTFKGDRLTDLDLEGFGFYIGQFPTSPWAEERYTRWHSRDDCRTLGDLLSRLYGWQPAAV